MESRLKLLERLKIQLQGHLYIGKETLDGWKEPTPVYIFNYPIHGYVKSPVRGRDKLECPECLKELEKSNQYNKPKKTSI